jgi:hypothetical protein
MQVWPKIHARVPGSTLEVYYGWTKGMLQFLERNGDRGKRFKNSIDTMLKVHFSRKHLSDCGSRPLDLA